MRIVSGSGYTDETIIVEAIPKANCLFRGWYCDASLVSKSSLYEFVMPGNDYQLNALFVTNEQNEWDISHGVVPTYIDNNTITFGLFPKTHVSDQALISSLNSLTETAENGWYYFDGEYYVKQAMIKSASETILSFDDGSRIVEGTYWFKCEPIEWIAVSSTENGRCFLLSKYLIDANMFFTPNPGVYSDYETCSLRSWLNDDFYNSAFYLNKSPIQNSSYNYSSYSLSNAFNDYVVLPKYEELGGGYATKCVVTEYGRTRGGWYNRVTASNTGIKSGKYWTSTPYSGYEVVIVSEDGTKWFSNAKQANICVRPAIIIDY